MIVDTSATIAVLKHEPGSEAIVALLEHSTSLRMSAVNWFETCQLVDGGRMGIVASKLESLLLEFGVTIEAFTSDQATIARVAFNAFGKGMGAPKRGSISATVVPTHSQWRPANRCSLSVTISRTPI